jgi:uncharacterized protein YegP (UPF0339 family)
VAAKLVLIERKDGKWGWSLYGDNGSDIIATDGGQGYEKKATAREMAEKVISGHYDGVEVRRRDYDR